MRLVETRLLEGPNVYRLEPVVKLEFAVGGARGLGATIAQVREGLTHFAPSAERSPGRLNLFRLGTRVVIADFAHNEAGITAVLDAAKGIAAGAAGRTTRSEGSAGSPQVARSESPSRRRPGTRAAGRPNPSWGSCWPASQRPAYPSAGRRRRRSRPN